MPAKMGLETLSLDPVSGQVGAIEGYRLQEYFQLVIARDKNEAVVQSGHVPRALPGFAIKVGARRYKLGTKLTLFYLIVYNAHQHGSFRPRQAEVVDPKPCELPTADHFEGRCSTQPDLQIW